MNQITEPSLPLNFLVYGEKLRISDMVHFFEDRTKLKILSEITQGPLITEVLGLPKDFLIDGRRSLIWAVRLGG